MLQFTKKIEYIINGIYVENKLPKLCSQLIFKRLLLKLTAANTFMLNLKFYKQVDGCSMGGPVCNTFQYLHDKNRQKSG